MLSIFLAAAPAFAAPPLEVHVEPGVTQVILVCGAERLTSEVTKGVATFASAPTNCSVQVMRPIGTIPGPGIYNCATSGGCTLAEVRHASISDAHGRVNIVLTGTYDTQWLELTCPDGYRARADIAENTATFNGATSDCELHFKGGAPARYRPIGAGSFRCSLTGATAVCSRFSP